MPKNTEKKGLKIGDRISDVIEVQGISPPELARAIGCTRSYMSQLLRNEIRHPHKFLDALSEVLNKDKAWLLSGVSPVTEKSTSVKETVVIAQGIGSTSEGMELGEYRVFIQPHGFQCDTKAWLFLSEHDVLKKETFVITEVNFSPGSGLFLGYDNQLGEYQLVHRKDNVDGCQFFNKSDSTQIIGRILFYTVMDEGKKYEKVST